MHFFWSYLIFTWNWFIFPFLNSQVAYLRPDRLYYGTFNPALSPSV